MTWSAAELLASPSRTLSRACLPGTTANPHVSDGHTPAQDGPNARTKLVQKELPVERDQGLGVWIHERTDRPLEPFVGVSDGSRVGLDFLYPSRPIAHGPRNDPPSGCCGARRQALGGSEGLSFIR